MRSPAPQAFPPDLPSDIELFCPGCGYSLRGIDSPQCPECGLHVDRSAAAVSRIPWEHRRQLGPVRAYWRTLWMSTRLIAADMVRPVNYRDARLFQLITVLLASLPLAALAALPLPFLAGLGNWFNSWPMVVPPGWLIDLTLPLLAGLGLRVLPVAVVLYLLAMTGVGSYFFHPPHLTVVQQNRAIALSYYATAPLVLLIVPGVMALAGVALNTYRRGWLDRYDDLLVVLDILIATLPAISLLMLWLATLRMLRHATVCSTARVAALAVTLPLAWAALAGLILIGLPWLVGFAMMVVWSVQ